MTRATLAVIAKAPVEGRVKTRLCPPCTPAQAAAVAEVALSMTCAAVSAVPDVRRVLVLDGDLGEWAPSGFEVIAQVNGGLGARLAAAHQMLGARSLILGMDTPQVTPDALERCIAVLDTHDVSFGPAADGGYWIVGQRTPDERLFDNVTMSTDRTLAEQLAQVTALGYRYALTDTLVDIDSFQDLVLVAEELPGSPLAKLLAGSGSDVAHSRSDARRGVVLG